MSEAIHPSEPEDLAARLRAGDDEALTQAYGICFGGQVGRIVLAHILRTAGLGKSRNHEIGLEGRAYEDGRLDNALEIARRAGFDQAAVIATELSTSYQMEGRTHERTSEPFGGPDRAADLPD